MKTTRGNGDAVLALLLNMLLNLEWTIPAWILLVCHFLFGWSILWFCLALAVWFGGIILWNTVLAWANRCGSEPEKPKENKNPYSAGAYKPNSKGL